MRSLVLGSVAALAALALASAPASADVLLSPPPKRMTTSGCLSLGVWYREGYGGSRWITVSVHYRGKRKTRRRIRATNRWRNHMLWCPQYPNSGRWYTKVRGGGWNVTYRTRVVIDRD